MATLASKTDTSTLLPAPNEDARDADLVRHAATLSRLVDANIIGVATCDADGRILEANDAYLDMLGYRREDLSSGRLRWQELTPPEWQAVSKQARAQIEETGRCELFEKEYFRKDGSRVPILLASAAIDESKSRIVGFVLDLTARKHAENELRRSEIELRDVIETIAALAWSYHPDGSNVFVNKRWTEYTGLSSDQMAAGMWESVIHPDDRPISASNCARCAETGEPFEEEIRLRRAADGEYRWFLVRIVPLMSSDRTILKWNGIATDIDDRKRAELDRDRSRQALRRSEAYLAEAQKLTHTGSWAASSATGLATYWSEETFRIFERSHAAGMLDQKGMLEVIHPDDREACRSAIGDAVQRKVDFSVDFRIVLPNGNVKHLQKIGHPILDETAAVVQWVGTIVDITERKKADEERDRVRRLENERETAIANERSRLAGEIHDTLAQGLAMIVMQLADAEAKLGPAWSQAEKPLSMVRELAVESLAYARRSVNMLRPNVDAGGLARSIRDVVDSVRRHFAGSLILDVTGDAVLLDAAIESALVGIVREALTNAVKHSNASRITVELNFAHGAVRAVVADDGIGFDANTVRPDAYGLVSMQERAARAGVALTFVTEPGAGTTIVASRSPENVELRGGA